MLMGLHHVQLAMPKGGEAKARDFYSGVLEMHEVMKPDALVGNGGCWFEQGSLRVHLGVEEPFKPAKKAHPAFMVASLGVARDKLAARGVKMTEGDDLPGLRRVFIADPFGNRIEILERSD